MMDNRRQSKGIFLIGGIIAAVILVLVLVALFSFDDEPGVQMREDVDAVVEDASMLDEGS